MERKDYDEADKILDKVESGKKMTIKEKILLRDYLLETYPTFADNLRRSKRLKDVS